MATTRAGITYIVNYDDSTNLSGINTKWKTYTKSIQEQINDILERLTILES